MNAVLLLLPGRSSIMLFPWLARRSGKLYRTCEASGRRRRVSLTLEQLEERRLLATLLVNTTADNNARDNYLSLREAILLTNGDPALTYNMLTAAEKNQIINGQPGANQQDTIQFTIGNFPNQIQLTSALPVVTDSIIIDGTPRGPSYNLQTIELSVGLAGANVDGLTISAGNSTGKGLLIDGFGSNGIILKGQGGNQVLNNTIGYNAVNGGDGVVIDNIDSNLIQGNLISNNALDGILITGSEAFNNQVYANQIGTTPNGAVSIPNGSNGVDIAFGATGNAVGAAGQGNLISSNGQDGVLLGPGTSENTVRANLIGINKAGTGALPNVQDGVHIERSSANTVGGTAQGQGNVISGNQLNGVKLLASATTNVVQGNLIGTDPLGSFALPNGKGSPGPQLPGGVWIENSANNTIGGDTDGARNIISRNVGKGVKIWQAGSQNNVVLGNYIGTDINGRTDSGSNNSPLGNSHGVWIEDAPHNTVGGTTASAGNLISGNLGDGVVIWDPTAGEAGGQNKVIGNSIGTDHTGMAPLPNANGIRVYNSMSNTIGGLTSGERNIISGNTLQGIDLEGSAQTLIQGNFIGITSDGEGRLDNGMNGILMNNASTYDTIGGTAAGAGNVISGNGSNAAAPADGSAPPNGHGIALWKADHSTIQGNYIGTDSTGSGSPFDVSNKFDGIYIDANANIGTDSHDNTIGGDAAGAGNIISGNNRYGVEILGHKNVLDGNSIGLDAAGQPLKNRIDGVRNVGPNNTIKKSNKIAFNGRAGVSIAATADTTVIDGNSIYSNEAQGILIEGGNNQLITANSLSSNGAQGILVQVSDGDLIQTNSITGNLLDGIVVNGNSSNNVIGGSGQTNTISQNGSAGVHFVSGNGNTVSFNTISQNPLGGILVEGGSPYPTTHIDENVLDSLVVSAGSADVAGPSPVDDFLFSGGTLGGPAVLTVNVFLHWTAGTMIGSGSTDVASTATGTIDNPATLELQRVFNNSGTIAWTGNGSLSIDAGAVFNNLPPGVYNAQGNGALASLDSTGRYNNTGTFNESGHATVPSPTGTLTFVNSATMRVLAAGVFAMQGTWTQTAGGTTVAGTGALTVIGPVSDNAGPISLGDYRAGGALAATAGTQVASGALLSGQGTVTGNLTTAGEVEVLANGGSSGTLNLAGNYTQTAGLTDVTASTNFNGTGTYTQSGGSTTVAASDNVSFSGVVAVNGGTFNLGDPAPGASLDAPAGLQVGSGGVFTGSGSIYGAVTTAGEFDAPSGPLSVTGTYTQTAGTTTVHGNGLSVSDLVDVRGGYFNMVLATVGALNGMQIDAGATLEGAGHITVAGNLTNAGLIDIEGARDSRASPVS
jgi:parallel beta-helix repeat protein